MAATDTSADVLTPNTRSAAAKARGKKDSEQRLKRAQRASILLKHVSDATRLQIILFLDAGERHVGDLSTALNQTQPAVSHHLALMRHGGIVLPRRQGKNNFYSLTETGQELAKVVRAMIS
jgi:DNA-binding transcriptional ArsR family regulator